MAHSNVKRNKSSGWYLWLILSIVALLVLLMWIRGCTSISDTSADFVVDRPIVQLFKNCYNS